MRDNTGYTFPETTDEFYEFLQERADADFKPDIAISDDAFKKFIMHSAEVPLATIICKDVVVPIVITLISSFLYDLASSYLKARGFIC